MSNNEEQHVTKRGTTGPAQKVEPGEEAAAAAPAPEDLDARQEAISEERRRGGPALDEAEPEPEEDTAAAVPADVPETDIAPVPGGSS